MPFTKIKRGKGKGKYRSPSGRIFNKKQVARYYARGGSFDGFYCDAPLSPSGDPTGTFDLRRQYGAKAEQKFRSVRAVLQRAIVTQDILGLKPQTISALALASSNVQLAFQTWFDELLKRVVLEGTGEWMRPMIANSYNRAVKRGMRLTNGAVPINMTAQIDALQQLAVHELQGICEAVSQRVMRNVGLAVIQKSEPSQAFVDMSTAIMIVGVTRAKAMIELMVVKAFSTGTLDQFEAAGVKKVGLIPETRPPLIRKDSIQDAPVGFRGTGPGSRTTAEVVPSRRTVGRIRAAQAEVEALFGGMVNVETAGDDLVCQECQDIEDGNPYTIDEARSLIPAHPRCRCAFMPADDMEN